MRPVARTEFAKLRRACGQDRASCEGRRRGSKAVLLAVAWRRSGQSRGVSERDRHKGLRRPLTNAGALVGSVAKAVA